MKCSGVIAGCCLCKIAHDYTAGFLLFLKFQRRGTAHSEGAPNLRRLWTLPSCLKVFETCICALLMLSKQLSAAHLGTEGMYRMASSCELNLQEAARECILYFDVNE